MTVPVMRPNSALLSAVFVVLSVSLLASGGVAQTRGARTSGAKKFTLPPLKAGDAGIQGSIFLPLDPKEACTTRLVTAGGKRARASHVIRLPRRMGRARIFGTKARCGVATAGDQKFAVDRVERRDGRLVLWGNNGSSVALPAGAYGIWGTDGTRLTRTLTLNAKGKIITESTVSPVLDASAKRKQPKTYRCAVRFMAKGAKRAVKRVLVVENPDRTIWRVKGGVCSLRGKPVRVIHASDEALRSGDPRAKARPVALPGGMYGIWGTDGTKGARTLFLVGEEGKILHSKTKTR